MEPELWRLRDPSELLSNVRTFRTSEAISIYAPQGLVREPRGEPLPRIFGKELSHEISFCLPQLLPTG